MISPKRALTTLPEKSDRPRGSRTPTLFSNHCNSQARHQGNRSSYRDYSLACCNTPSSTNCCTVQGEQLLHPAGPGCGRDEQPLQSWWQSWGWMLLLHCFTRLLLPQVTSCRDAAPARIGSLIPILAVAGRSMLAAPELPPPGKPEAAKLGDEELNHLAAPFGS